MEHPQGARTLVLMRHAEARSAAGSDHERPLTDAGRDQAREVGAWLAGRVEAPADAVVSSATRTQETWRWVSDAAGWDLEAGASRAAYSADVDSLLDLIRAHGPESGTLCVVGHAPTVPSLAMLLSDGDGDPEVLDRMTSGGWPPSGCAVFAVEGEWADLAFGGGRLTAYVSG